MRASWGEEQSEILSTECKNSEAWGVSQCKLYNASIYKCTEVRQ
jgi:hypothetical protein